MPKNLMTEGRDIPETSGILLTTSKWLCPSLRKFSGPALLWDAPSKGRNLSVTGQSTATEGCRPTEAEGGHHYLRPSRYRGRTWF